MEPIQMFLIIITLFSAMNLAYQIYKMTVLDAISRGLKRPRFWGLFATGGQNCSGMLLYLIGRRKYPSSMSQEDQIIMESRKKKILVCLVFMLISSIMLIGYMSLYQ